MPFLCKKLENWTKYMKQLFPDIGQKIAGHCNSFTNELSPTCQKQKRHMRMTFFQKHSSQKAMKQYFIFFYFYFFKEIHVLLFIYL